MVDEHGRRLLLGYCAPYRRVVHQTSSMHIHAQVMDTMGSHWVAWTRVAKEYGLTITPSQFLGFAGRPTSGIFATLCEEQVCGWWILLISNELNLIYWWDILCCVWEAKKRW